MKLSCLLPALAGIPALSITSCTVAEPGELGRRFSETVPGTWTTDLRLNGGIAHAEKTFNPDGTASGRLSAKKRSGRVSFVMPAGSFRSKWRVEGDTYISYAIESTVPGLFPPGTEIRDTILGVGPDRIVCRAENEGLTFIMKRNR